MPNVMVYSVRQDLQYCNKYTFRVHGLTLKFGPNAVPTRTHVDENYLQL